MKVACEDHNGHNSAYMAKWDGTKWVQGSDWIAPLKTKVRPLIESAAKDYATANAGWPKRTEACDKSS
jgi:branched-chain amino acid transport system substrate-binding protein